MVSTIYTAQLPRSNLWSCDGHLSRYEVQTENIIKVEGILLYCIHTVYQLLIVFLESRVHSVKGLLIIFPSTVDILSFWEHHRSSETKQTLKCQSMMENDERKSHL